MVFQHQISLPVFSRGYHLITEIIEQEIKKLNISEGVVNLLLMHTSAAITINENADPTVRQDFETFLNKLIPENFPYRHTMEGSDDMPAHLKASLIGQSLALPVKNGQLVLGTWQGIYLCEFRNRNFSRSIFLTAIS